MTAIIVAVVAVAALVAGFIFGSMQGKATAGAVAAAKDAEIEARKREVDALNAKVASAMLEIAAHMKDKTALEVELATLRTERKSDEEKMKELVAAREQLANQFEVLANKILEEKSKKFTEQNQQNLGQLLNPLRDRIKEFQEKVDKVYGEERDGRTKLTEQVRQLMQLNMQISTEASNLTKALTDTGKAQGDWGELILERMLEGSGLRKDHDYFVQQNLKNDEQKNVRPDIIVRLPDDRSLIIDSKMSFPAYNEYVAATDEAARADAVKRHLASIRTHFTGLSKKSYEDLRGLKSPDFVIMFVPLEAAFLLAISNDAALWEDAYRGGVLLVSPTNLLFVLRTVAQLWKTEEQKRNVDEIAKRGSAMYEKLVGFVEDMQKVGERLEQAKATHGEAFAKLHTGTGNLVGQAEKMRKLGLKVKKQLPQSLLPDGSEDDEPEKMDAANA